jgi:hypothetical protein
LRQSCIEAIARTLSRCALADIEQRAGWSSLRPYFKPGCATDGLRLWRLAIGGVASDLAYALTPPHAAKLTLAVAAASANELVRAYALPTRIRPSRARAAQLVLDVEYMISCMQLLLDGLAPIASELQAPPSRGGAAPAAPSGCAGGDALPAGESAEAAPTTRFGAARAASGGDIRCGGGGTTSGHSRNSRPEGAVQIAMPSAPGPPSVRPEAELRALIGLCQSMHVVLSNNAIHTTADTLARAIARARERARSGAGSQADASRRPRATVAMANGEGLAAEGSAVAVAAGGAALCTRRWMAANPFAPRAEFAAAGGSGLELAKPLLFTARPLEGEGAAASLALPKSSMLWLERPRALLCLLRAKHRLLTADDFPPLSAELKETEARETLITLCAELERACALQQALPAEEEAAVDGSTPTAAETLLQAMSQQEPEADAAVMV